MTDQAGTFPGLTTVSERAMRAVIEAVAAGELGVARKDVSARMADSDGALSVEIRGQVAVRPLGETQRSVIQAGLDTKQRVIDDGSRITGARIGAVAVTVTGAQVKRKERA